MPLAEVRNLSEFLLKLLDEDQKQRDNIHSLSVEMFPHAATVDTRALWRNITKLLPNIGHVTISFNERKYGSQIPDDDTLVHDFGGLAVLVEAYKEQLDRILLHFEFDGDGGSMIKKCIYTTNFVGALSQLKELEEWKVYSCHYNRTVDDGNYFDRFVSPFYNAMLHSIGTLGSLKYLWMNVGNAPTVNAPFICPRLEYLHLVDTTWNAEWLAYLLEQDTALEHVVLDFYGYSDTNVPGANSRLGAALADHKCVKYLKLFVTNPVNDVSASHHVLGAFGEALHRNNSLESVDLEYESSEGSDHASLSKLFDGFAACKQITAVEVTDYGSTSPTALRAFARMLRAHKTWERIGLFLEGNSVVSKEIATDVADAIRCSACNVQELVFNGGEILGWEDILSAGLKNPTFHEFTLGGVLPQYTSSIKGFAKALAANRNLRRLEIFASGEGGLDQSFVDAMKSNYCIEHLHLSDVDWDQRHEFHVIGALNRAGRKYMLEENIIEKGIECLSNLSGISNSDTLLDCIFFHLQENVAVFFDGDESDGLKREINPKNEKLQSLIQETKDVQEQLTHLKEKQSKHQRKRKRGSDDLATLAIPSQRRRAPGETSPNALNDLNGSHIANPGHGVRGVIWNMWNTAAALFSNENVQGGNSSSGVQSPPNNLLE